MIGVPLLMTHVLEYWKSIQWSEPRSVQRMLSEAYLMTLHNRIHFMARLPCFWFPSEENSWWNRNQSNIVWNGLSGYYFLCQIHMQSFQCFDMNSIRIFAPNGFLFSVRIMSVLYRDWKTVILNPTIFHLGEFFLVEWWAVTYNSWMISCCRIGIPFGNIFMKAEFLGEWKLWADLVVYFVKFGDGVS